MDQSMDDVMSNSGFNSDGVSNSLDKDAFQISDKVKVLIDMLCKSHRERSDCKTIIFVKDRSVAVYLKKLLSGDSANDSQDSFLQPLLNREMFRIEFAMGFKARNIVNRAYKSLNTEQMSLEEDVLGQLPSIGTIKLSQKKLKETLSNFRSGIVNVLIATNVVEEGLDVSTCNQVICLNEI